MRTESEEEAFREHIRLDAMDAIRWEVFHQAEAEPNTHGGETYDTT